MKKILFLLLMVGLLSECSIIEKQQQKKRAIMDSWLGSTGQKLILSWGPPNRTTSDGANGKVLIYATQLYLFNNIYWDYKFFYTNGDGIIYHWMTKREQVPPTQVNLNIYGQ